MQRTLSEHIAFLEQKIETLKKRLEEPGRTVAEQNETEIDIGIAERALVHFRKAFDFLSSGSPVALAVSKPIQRDKAVDFKLGHHRRKRGIAAR